MPELPEVQTTVSGLNKTIKGLVINDVWNAYDSPYFYGSKTVKDPKYFLYFKKMVKGNKILGVDRRAKNILINLSNGHTILIHMKMTGHVMYGDYNKKDPYNRHIRMIFYLSNGKTMELCDSRKFAKVTLLETATKDKNEHLNKIGPEPLDKNFDFEIFNNQLQKKIDKKIKLVLMDQGIIAGIGNIYADESLWRAGLHPESLVKDISREKRRVLYNAIKIVLSRGIDFGGDSMSDYRNIHGEKGKFQERHMAYRRTGMKCLRKGCAGKIVRSVVGGRGTHYCNVHQKET